jgi:hypothetical protein
MALKRLSTSEPSCERRESLVADEVSEVLADCDEGAGCDSSVVSADWALVMSSEESAEETLEMNSPSGLDESALEGVSFSTSER